MSSERALLDCLDLLSAEEFYLQQNAFVFTAIQGLSNSGTPVDPVTVQAELERLGKPGAGDYVLELFGSMTTATNAEYWARIIADHAIRRRVIEGGHRAVQMGWDSTSEPSEIVETVRSAFDQVAGSRKSSAKVWSVDEVAAARLEEYPNPPAERVMTGWPDLDAMLGGLLPGTLTIVAARPSVGKSVIGANIATNVASRGEGAAIFSLEMTKDELTDRILANLARVELSRIRDHMLEPDDVRRLREAALKLRSFPLRIVDLADIGVAGIRTISRDLTRTQRGLRVIVVDYLQLMRPADGRAPREQQVSAMSRGLKLLAKELLVPVVALCQVKRPQGGPRRPVLEDLRESGAIEQDADSVLLLHTEEDPYEIEVIVGKNRHGSKGLVKLGWAPYQARATSLHSSGWEEAA